MDPDEEMENSWSHEEVPLKHREILKRVPKRIRQHIRRTHRGLGHPSRETIVKMIIANQIPIHRDIGTDSVGGAGY